MNTTQINLVREDCQKSCTQINCFDLLNHQTILVTGGTGFVGKWIAEMLSFINDKLEIKLKLYLLATDIEQFKKEVPHLYQKEWITLIKQDIRYIHDLPEQVNYIIHAAGSPDSRVHISEPLKTVETVYRGTQALLEAATRVTNLKKIIHLSSHQVYGSNDDTVLIDENYKGFFDFTQVENSYAESKRISEMICSYYKNSFKLPITILRPFSFIGPYQKLEKPWAINNFIRDAILGGPIKILGNSLTERSYLYASDMAFWILKSLIDNKDGQIYNLGSNNSISLNDLAIKIRNQMNSKIGIISKSSKENYFNISKLVPDTNRINRDLNVREIFDIDKAIDRTILWNQLRDKF